MNLPKKCVGKESFQRMNYLLQLTNLLSTENPAAHVAADQYTNLMVNISRKAVQRLDIDVKRTICKGCRSLLIPGITSKVRIKKKKLLIHCLKCARIKTHVVKGHYASWTQTVESQVELLDYQPTNQSNIENSNK